jgi:intein/homing endonuclease
LKFVPQAIFKAPKDSVKLFLQALFSGDGSVYHQGQLVKLEYYSNSRRLIEDVHHLLLRFGIVSFIKEKITHIGTTAHRVQITDWTQILKFANEIGFWQNSEKQIRLDEEILPIIHARSGKVVTNFDSFPIEAWPLVSEAKAFSGKTFTELGSVRSKSHQSLSRQIAAKVASVSKYPPLMSLVDGDQIWDTVKSIEYVGEEEVYDLTIPHTHNFIANNIYIHNSTYARCGLIVNVTPLEPLWHGHVTLEISNTTPLPAKVYSNEGVAQVMFFEADEECEISYGDKKGKYQGQTGVTPPRM